MTEIELPGMSPAPNIGKHRAAPRSSFNLIPRPRGKPTHVACSSACRLPASLICVFLAVAIRSTNRRCPSFSTGPTAACRLVGKLGKKNKHYVSEGTAMRRKSKDRSDVMGMGWRKHFYFLFSSFGRISEQGRKTEKSREGFPQQSARVRLHVHLTSRQPRCR